jgi:hypothetical protein
MKFVMNLSPNITWKQTTDECEKYTIYSSDKKLNKCLFFPGRFIGSCWCTSFCEYCTNKNDSCDSSNGELDYFTFECNCEKLLHFFPDGKEQNENDDDNKKQPSTIKQIITEVIAKQYRYEAMIIIDKCSRFRINELIKYYNLGKLNSVCMHLDLIKEELVFYKILEQKETDIFGKSQN